MIFRVDFTGTISIDDEKLHKKCLLIYPLVQDELIKEETINTEMDEKGGMSINRAVNQYVNKRYSNRQMTRRIIISPKFVLIELNDYLSYTDTKEAFMSAFSILQ